MKTRKSGSSIITTFLSAITVTAVLVTAFQIQVFAKDQEIPLPFDYLSRLDMAQVNTPCGDRDTGVEFILPDSALIQNGGKFLNVKNPPQGVRAAVGDGVADDTEALKDALDYMKNIYVKEGWYGPNIHIYLPNGTYLVADTVFYRGDAVSVLQNGGIKPPSGVNVCDLCVLRVTGQNREKVTIKLKDFSAGFADPNAPKAVIKNYHEKTLINNAAAKTMLNNLTVDTGSSNPGAVGITLVSANRCEISNVRIKSGDGQGIAGFLVDRACMLGLFHDMTIEGFDYGIKYGATETLDMQTAGFEHITLKNQNRAALYFYAGSTAIRKALSVQTKKGVSGAEVAGQQGAQLVLLDSQFAGNDSELCAVSAGFSQYEHLFVRNLKTQGYKAAVSVAGEIKVNEAEILECSSISVAGKTANLAVEDMPVLYFPEQSRWANVDNYGATGNGVSDDTAAVQAALDSGRPLIYFPKDKYKFTTVHVPETVSVIYGMGAILEGKIDVNKVSAAYLHIYDVYDRYLNIELSAQRNLAINYGRYNFSNKQSLPVKIHIANSVSVGLTPDFCGKNTLMFARAINTESMNSPNFKINGGIIWCLNFKTENKPQPAFYVSEGGFAEILSGFISVPPAWNWQPEGIYAFVATNGANMSLIAATTQKCGFYELISAGGAVYRYDTFPQRVKELDSNRFIPLFTSYTK